SRAAAFAATRRAPSTKRQTRAAASSRTSLISFSVSPRSAPRPPPSSLTACSQHHLFDRERAPPRRGSRSSPQQLDPLTHGPHQVLRDNRDGRVHVAQVDEPRDPGLAARYGRQRLG